MNYTLSFNEIRPKESHGVRSLGQKLFMLRFDMTFNEPLIFIILLRQIDLLKEASFANQLSSSAA